MCGVKKLLKFSIAIFFTSFILLPKSVNSTGVGRNNNDGIKVTDILKSLVIGKEAGALSVPENGNFDHNQSSNHKSILFLASPTTSRDGGNVRDEAQTQITSKPNPKLRQEERAARKAENAQELVDRALQIREMTEGPISKFEAKYLFKKGAYGNSSKSFDYLSISSETAKEYLVNLNLKWYKGGILPQKGGKQFDIWFNDQQLDKRFVLIVDQDINVLQNDISVKFDSWKNYELQKTGLVPIEIPTFETTDKQTVTQVVFHAVRDGNDIVGVDVKATQFQTHISLGMSSDEKLIYVESIITDNVEPLREMVITRFTVEELRKNAELCDKFWKKLGVPRSQKAFVLNEQYPPYKQAKKNFKERFENKVIKLQSISGMTLDEHEEREGGICFGKGQAKRSIGGGGKGGNCAIFIDRETGKVESILAENFMKKYKNGNEEEKKHLSKLAKENMDKVVIGERLESDYKMLAEARMEIGSIVEMESIKDHVRVISMVTEVQDLKRINGVKPEKFLRNMKERLGNSKVKISSSKLAISIATSKYLSGFGEGVGKNRTKLGSRFLAQTVVNGIMHGDTTALAIIGARVGYNVTHITCSGGGTKYSSVADAFTDLLEELGEWVEKGVDAVDFALDLNSFAKNIGRYFSSTNQYDRNDAIAEIVEASIGMAITAAVLDVGAAFPPLAPVAAVIGFAIDMLAKLAVATYKTWNEVNRIDSEIGLLDFEKREVFESRFLDLFGTRRKDYIDYTLEEKALNELAVEYNLEVLKKNEDRLRGIVFPSKTLQYDGGCTLRMQQCTYRMRIIVWFCVHWEEEKIIGTGCDWNKPCPSEDMPCTDFTNRLDYISYNQFSCKCDSSKKPENNFGPERKDQFVDFREKQTVFWEKAVPKDVEGGEFICKPGSTKYLDYKTTKPESRVEYLCENAIGLLQPTNKWRDGQSMLFDLKDGVDTVYLDGRDTTASIFRVGKCGVKNFVGSGGKNEFLIDGEGDCGERLEGKLVGGMGQNDTITIMRNFSRGDNLRVDLKEGYLRSIRMDKINMKFEGVEELTGREGEVEEVIVGCGTKRVVLRGGRMNESDTVTVPENNGCQYDLTVMATAYSSVDSKAKQGNITLLIGDPFAPDLQASFDIYPNNTPKVSVIFTTTPSHQIRHGDLYLDGQKMTTHLKSVIGSAKEKEVKLTFRGQGLSKEELERDILVHFVERPSGAPYSVLVMSSKEGRESVVFHTLPPKQAEWKLEEMTRYGSLTVKNVFEIKGNDWISIGGNNSDDFVVNARPLQIHGKGGDDTVRLHKDLNETLVIALNLTGPRFTGIENVIGSPNKSVSVTCACDTNLVAVMGGHSPQNRNVVSIPKMQNCGKRSQQLQIVAKGNSRVEVMGEVADFKVDGVVVTAISSSNNITNNETKSFPLSFEFEGGTQNLSGLLLNLRLSYKNWTVTTAKREGQYVISSLSGTSPKLNQSESIKLKLAVGNLTSDEHFVANPFIQVVMQDTKEVPGHLVIDKETGKPNIMYMLGENASTIEGFWEIPNIFRVMNSSWTITGGLANDVFYVLTSVVNGTRIDGGNGGENSLILETSSSSSGKEPNKTFGVNLEKGTFGFLGVPGNERGRLAGIHHVVGRSSKPDMIYTTCSTKSVNGRGGLSKGQEDVILISGINCTNKLDLSVDFGGKFTNVKNSAKLGSFNYYVRDWMTNGLDLNVADDNQHNLNFRFDPWPVVKDVEYKKESKSLIFQLGNNESSEIKTQVFQMAGSNNETGKYTNPILRFHQPGSPITTDIRVSVTKGVVAATILLRGRGLMENEQIFGLPVDINRFLINATTKAVEASGGIIRGSSKSKANQFWIFQLNSTLDILDGGPKNDEMPGFSAKNSLHFAETLFPTVDLEVDLSLENGFLRKTGSKDEKLIKLIQNIHEFHGRDISTAKDTAYVTCNTQSVHQVENVYIRSINQTISANTSTCSSVNLVIGLGNYTKVVFLGGSETSTFTNATTLPTNVFHYKFTVPRSFDLEAAENDDDYRVNMLISTASHNYYLAIKLDDIKSLRFDLNEECLSYSLFSTNLTYSHHMIGSTTYSDQFYPQPEMITQDGFRIQVARTGSILLSLGASSSFPSLENIQSKVIPALEKASQRLDITIMVQTDKEFLYIGHDANSSESRNVLESSEVLTSHLVGSGGNDTIYEIKSLKSNVFIYSGLELSPQTCDKCPKQTVDLTDVVMAIRMNFGVKYVPSVNQVGTDLVIFMEGHQDEFPGKLVLVNGSMENVSQRFQILLHIKMMDLLFERGTSNWNLVPRPVVVPQGYVYSIASADLENCHDIQFGSASVAKLDSATLTAAKNGYDLYLSDIKAVQINGNTTTTTTIYTTSGFKEITTLKITDFYKRYGFTPRREYSLADFDKSLPYPTNLFEVKISFPGGLYVILNDTQVFFENQLDEEIAEKTKPNLKINGGEEEPPLKLTPARILEWKCVLHDVEQQVLRDMQDIPRVYYRDECVDHYWANIAAMMGSFIGGVLVLLLVANWRLIRDKIGKKSSGVKEERQPLLSTQPSYQAT